MSSGDIVNTNCLSTALAPGTSLGLGLAEAGLGCGPVDGFSMKVPVAGLGRVMWS